MRKEAQQALQTPGVHVPLWLAQPLPGERFQKISTDAAGCKERERGLRKWWFLARKEFGTNVVVDRRGKGSWLCPKWGHHILYREEKQQLANLSPGKAWLKGEKF